MVVERPVGVRIGVGVLRLGQQTQGLLQVEFLAVVQAKIQEPLIAVLPGQMVHDLQGAPAHRRIVAEHVGPQPFASHPAIIQNSAAHHVVNGRIVVHQQADQGGPLLGRQSGG